MEPTSMGKWNLPESARIASLLAEIPTPPELPHVAAAPPSAATEAASPAAGAAAEPVAERANPSLGALAAATSAWFSRPDESSAAGAGPRPAVFGAHRGAPVPAEPPPFRDAGAKPLSAADAAFLALPLREALAAVNWRNDPALRRKPDAPPPDDWQETPVEELMRGFVWE